MAATRVLMGLLELLEERDRTEALDALRASGIIKPPPAPAVPLDPAVLAERLRAAGSLRDCRNVLNEANGLDWDHLFAEHRRSPFGRIQRRALIERQGCTEELTCVLIDPWDAWVARTATVCPRSLSLEAVRHAGSTSANLIEKVIAGSGLPMTEVIAECPDFGMLVAQLNRRFWMSRQTHAVFWEEVARFAAPSLDTDARAWAVASARLRRHRGGVRGFLRRGIVRSATLPPAEEIDLSLLAWAPREVIAEVIGSMPDEQMRKLGIRLGPGRDRMHGSWPVMRKILEDLRQSGVAPRPAYAAWSGLAGRLPTGLRAWLYGQDPHADRITVLIAEHNAELRRSLAPPRPAPLGALVPALRAATDVVEAESALPPVDEALPWDELVKAHDNEPFGVPALLPLSARDGFPTKLAESLRDRDLSENAGLNPAIAHTLLRRVRVNGWSPSPLYFPERGYHQAVAAGTASATEVLDVAEPAFSAARWAVEAADNHLPDVNREVAELVTTHARGAPPEFWVIFSQTLPRFTGTLPELLAVSRALAE